MATSVGAVALDLSVNKATTSALTSSLKKVGSVIASVFAVSQITSFTKACVESASEVQSAFTGLNSIVQGTGNSFKAAQDFINEYTADGLVSIEETATAYKNLLSRGYDTSQIENVLTRLKDSAAFGRQASYDLGEAVVSATEGLKNENSILVDNAGVTKNVAKMWEEWADAHNTTTSAMTQAQKIEAEYNGIMEETKFQVGDAAAYTQTFSGQVQQLKFNFNQMKTAIGQVVTPLAQLFIPVINSAITAVTNFFNTIGDALEVFGLSMPTVVSKSSSAVSDLSSSISDTADTAVSSAKKITKAFAGVDEINVLKTSDSSSSDDSTSSSSGTTYSSTIDTSGVETSSSKITKIFEELKDTLISVWNSSPIQAYVNCLTTSLKFARDLVVQIGTDMYINMTTTWNNIRDNLSITFDNISLLFTDMWIDMATGINTWGQPIIDGISSLFNSIWSTAIDPSIQLITQKWAEFSQILVDLWEEYGTPLTDKIGEFVTNVIGYFQSIYDNIIEPIITPFLETLSWLWDKHIKGLVEEVGEFVLELVNFALDIYNKFILPIYTYLTEKLAPGWSFICTLITGVLGTIIGVITDTVGGIIKWFKGLIEFLDGVFTGDWDKVWTGIKDMFSGTFQSITGVAKGVVNAVIDVLNSMIAGINKINFKVPDWVPVLGGEHVGLNIPKIPKLAQGGYVPANNPQLAIVGDNKQHGEIIAPDDKIYNLVDKAIKDNNTTTNQHLDMTIYVKYEDGKTMIKKINQTEIEAGEILLLA